MPIESNQQGTVKYAIVTPARNEGQFIERTLKSVVSQTIKPTKWIIINDGSTDDTKEVIEKYADDYAWIKLINISNRGFREYADVQSKLWFGFKLIDIKSVDFIVKLDADLSFDTTYFEELFKRFAENPELGIAGGGLYNVIKNKLVFEKNPLFHVRGATKVYRRECWNDIGGMPKHIANEVVDEIKAHMLGWKTKSFPELKVIHHRQTGAGTVSMMKWKIYQGEVAYFTGYSPLFMIFRCCRRMLTKPYLLGGLAMLYGFFRGYVMKLPQVNDAQLIRFLRRQQINKLLFRKTIWK